MTHLPTGTAAGGEAILLPAGRAPSRTVGEAVGPRTASASVTVAICTHNRIADVRRCCAALAPQVRRAGFDFILVDSGSDPREAEDLRRLASQAGARYGRAEDPGLSRARNLACAQSRSTWVAFLDDDTIPAPDWAQALRAALDLASPEVAVLGGRTIPLWPPGATARHVTERWKLLLSCIDEEGRGAVAAGRNICGANLAIRRDAVARVGGFPDSLGRVGATLLGGEESFVVESLADLGMGAVYDGSIAVWHCIPAERLTTDWVARRAFWEGVSQVAMTKALRRPVPRWLWRPKLALSLPLLWPLRLLSSNPDGIIRYHMALGACLAQSPKRLGQIWTGGSECRIQG